MAEPHLKTPRSLGRQAVSMEVSLTTLGSGTWSKRQRLLMTLVCHKYCVWYRMELSELGIPREIAESLQVNDKSRTKSRTTKL